MTFEYLQRVVVDGELTIDNIGQTVICANCDLGNEYYLIILTELGWTEILEYGPYNPDFNMLPATYTVKYNRIEYNQTKLENIIDKFLNDPKKGITQARETTLAEVREFLINPIDRLTNAI